MSVVDILDSNLFDGDYAQHDGRLREMITVEYASKLYNETKN